MKNALSTSKRQLCLSNLFKTQGMSGSQDQKERKTASIVTTTFFGQQIATAQFRFCNDRLTSRTDEWNNKELIKMT